MAGEARKTGEPADRVKEVIGDVIRGLERDRPGTEKTTLPDDPQFRRREEAIQQVAQNVCSVSVCRLWSGTWFVTLTARKPSGRLTRLRLCLLRQPPRLKSGSLPER